MASKSPKPDPAHLPEPPYSAPFAVAALSRAHAHAFDLVPDAETRSRIADFLGIAELTEARLKGALAPCADDAWRVEGRLTATLVQSCVVSLEPVRQTVDEPIQRDYLPDEGEEVTAEIEIDASEDDGPDLYTDTVDPGHLMTEMLALALDPYPRGENATLDATQFAPPGATPLDDAALKPFAGLAALRQKMAGDG